MARKTKANKAIKQIATYGLLALAATKLLKKKEVTETPTNGIGRAGSDWAIRTDKYGKYFIGYLYYKGKLMYSQGRFPTKGAARRFMNDVSKKGLIVSSKNLSKSSKKKLFDAYHNKAVRESKYTGQDKDKLFL